MFLVDISSVFLVLFYMIFGSAVALLLPGVLGSSPGGFSDVSLDESAAPTDFDTTPLWAASSSGQLLMADVENGISRIQSRDQTLQIHSDQWILRLEDMPLFGDQSKTYRLRPLLPVTTTGVYDVEGIANPPFPVISVYRQFCREEMNSLNSVVVDFWFLSFLKNTGLVPQVVGISEPMQGSVVQSAFRHVRGADRLGKLRIAPCPSRHALLEIRYILMEKLNGLTVLDKVIEASPVGRSIPIRAAVGYGIRMILALRELHSLNVVHGDTHFGNFVLYGDRDDSAVPETHGMKMIDFERARIFNPLEYAGDPCNESISHRGNIETALWNSPWESRKCFLSFRDDIHRVLVSIAAMIYGQAYTSYFTFLSADINDAAGKRHKRATLALRALWDHHRSRGHIFQVKGFHEYIATTGVEYLGEMFKGHSHFSVIRLIEGSDAGMRIQARFLGIEHLVMSMQSTDRPNYERIINILSQIHRLS